MQIISLSRYPKYFHMSILLQYTIAIFSKMKIKIFVDIARSKGALLSIKEDLKNRG